MTSRSRLPGEPTPRPGSIAAVAVALCLLAVLSALTGVALSAVSSCCGSSEPADGTPAVVGFVAAAPFLAAGIGLWSGRMSSRVLLVCTAVPLVVAGAASPYSLDLAGLVPFGLLGWLGLFWYLRRPAARGWVGHRSTAET